jgi:hypothetical protein
MACVALVAITCAGLLLGYAPDHWLRPFGDDSVMVDGRAARAEFYIGHPTENEADAFVLVHASGAGNYLLNFDDDDYRESSSREFMRLPFGVWMFTSMRKRPFATALPSQKENEFRISSSGHIVTIDF